MKNKETEERLIDFAVSIINTTKSMRKSKESSLLINQIIRSGTSCALNFGEAKGAESRKDFIHKMSLILKELRETYICLRIIEKAKLILEQKKFLETKKENNELISIFVSSIVTAKRNLNK